MRNEVSKNSVWEDAMLVLLMDMICDVHRRDDLRWHDIHIKSHNDQFRHWVNIKCITPTTGEDIGGDFMIYAIEMASCVMIYLPSFMKIGKGIHVILRFCLNNFRGFNVGITDGKGF
jgi:hypothetical protein